MSPRSFISSLSFVALALACALPLSAQRARTSPHETISAVIDGNRVTIVYGRPYTKDPKKGTPREIWGGLVPFGKVWRTGADEATLLITQKAIVFGDVTVPAGAYSLFTQPEADGSARLIINKQIGHWGTQYETKNDLVRVPLAKGTLPTAVDQFTMTIEKTSEVVGVLRLSWASTQYSAAFTVQK